MPKIKSHRGVKKRVKITGGGRLIRNCCGNSHLATKKRRERKRRLTLKIAVSKANRRVVKKLI
ncbi:MAG: 50S ribosomal protein L35 [bacterium]